MPEPVIEKKETELSGAEQLELERLRAQRAADEKRVEELQKQNRDLTMRDTISKSIAGSGIKSHLSDAELYKLISTMEGVTVTPSGDGTALHVERNGKPSTMKELIEAHAVKNQHMYDRRTIRSLIDSDNDAAITSKEDLKTTEDKIRWIAKHGAMAYERLGAFKVASLDPNKLTASDWAKLSIAQKTQIIADAPNGELVVSKILKRTGEKR